MSLQLTIAKILAGQTQGRASIASLNEAILLLFRSGSQWTDRIKCVSEHASELDLFGDGLVIRDAEGWQLTKAGRAFVEALDEIDLVSIQINKLSALADFRKPGRSPAGTLRRIA